MANVRDFYMRTEDDPRFREDQLEVYDSIEACINQVKMTLLTRKGEVLGEPGFGLEVDRYLFDLELNPQELTDDAYFKVDEYVTEAKKRGIKLEPNYTLDEKGRKIYALKIEIDGRTTPYAVLYD